MPAHLPDDEAKRRALLFALEGRIPERIAQAVRRPTAEVLGWLAELELRNVAEALRPEITAASIACRARAAVAGGLALRAETALEARCYTGAVADLAKAGLALERLGTAIDGFRDWAGPGADRDLLALFVTGVRAAATAAEGEGGAEELRGWARAAVAGATNAGRAWKVLAGAEALRRATKRPRIVARAELVG